MTDEDTDTSSDSQKKDKRFFQYKIASEMAEKKEKKNSEESE